MDDFPMRIYLPTKEDFYNRERLRTFVEGLAAFKHYVVGRDIEDVRPVWTATLNKEDVPAGTLEPETVFTPGVSPTLLNDIDTFVTERADFLEIHLFSVAREGDLEAFEATLYLEPEEYIISMSMLAKWGLLAPFLHWLDILQFTYETWHPLYSFDDGEVEMTTHEQALAGNITYLYSINLLNRATVEKLGRERVLGVSAWRVRELGDGSIFLLPELIEQGGQDEEYAYDKEEVAARLGLSLA